MASGAYTHTCIHSRIESETRRTPACGRLVPGLKICGIFDHQVAQDSVKNSVSLELTMQMQQFLCISNLERKEDPLK